MNSKWIRWSFWLASLGLAIGAALVLLYPLFPAPVFRLMWLDHLAGWAAYAATAAVFPGERIAYPGLRDVIFFNIAFVLVNGLQFGMIGAIVGLIVGRKKKPMRNLESSAT